MIGIFTIYLGFFIRRIHRRARQMFDDDSGKCNHIATSNNNTKKKNTFRTQWLNAFVWNNREQHSRLIDAAKMIVISLNFLWLNRSVVVIFGGLVASALGVSVASKQFTMHYSVEWSFVSFRTYFHLLRKRTIHSFWMVSHIMSVH